MPTDIRRIAARQAREERFAHRMYTALAERLAGDTAARLRELADQEWSHVEFWAQVAGTAPERVRTSATKYRLLLVASRLLGPAFIISWLERGEDVAIETYRRTLEDGGLSAGQREAVQRMLREEEEHEAFLEQGVEDERREYLGAAVLGLNDALVELTGGLTGLVSSISEPRVIGFAALIVGLAAAMSMAASNFLSVDIGESSELKPGKAAAYTGIAYLIVVLGLVGPFFVLGSRILALSASWVVAILVIAGFSYYSAVMQNASFKRRFTIMLALGLGVAVITFALGNIIGGALGISV